MKALPAMGGRPFGVKRAAGRGMGCLWKTGPRPSAARGAGVSGLNGVPQYEAACRLARALDGRPPNCTRRRRVAQSMALFTWPPAMSPC
eukprot:1312169-Pyramimonas_sp.AAC.1